MWGFLFGRKKNDQKKDDDEDEEFSQTIELNSSMVFRPFPLLDLPIELVYYIVSYFDIKELIHFSQVSKSMHKISHKIGWKNICQREFQILHNPLDNLDWREYYYLRKTLLTASSFAWNDVIYHGEKPSPRMAHSTTLALVENGKRVEQRMVIIGGQLSDKDRFNDIIHFNPETSEFSRPAVHGTVPRFARHTSVEVAGKVYTFGGFDGVGTYFDLAVYDPKTFTWSYPAVKGDIPQPRTNHAAAAVGSKMYVYGGNNSLGENDSYRILDDLCIFDTLTLTWTRPKTKGKSPGGRTAHSMVAIGKKLYLFGGGVWEPKPANRWIKKFNSLFVFDTERMEWTEPEVSGSIPICSFPLAFVIGCWIFFFGGQKIDQDFITNKLHCFDTVTLSCHELPADDFEGVAPKSRDLGTATVVNDTVLILAGSSGSPVDDIDGLIWRARENFRTYFKKVNFENNNTPVNSDV